MMFLYEPAAGAASVSVEQENHHYLFRVRRHREGDTIALCNLQDGVVYEYRVEAVGKKEARLTRVSQTPRPFAGPKLHLGWCVIDPKSVQAALPMLNELGVTKISFVTCDRSQKNFAPPLEKLTKILIASCQQSGRTELMTLETVDSLARLRGMYGDLAVIDFGGQPLEKGSDGERCFLIGCEGGFSAADKAVLEGAPVYGLGCAGVLRSETAAVAVAARLLV